MFYEQLDFRVLDVCCNEHVKEMLDEHPIEAGKLPQAIVYVIDISIQGNEKKEAIREFHHWISFLKNKYSSKQFSKLPFLILFNKIDLSPKFDSDFLNHQLEELLFSNLPAILIFGLKLCLWVKLIRLLPIKPKTTSLFGLLMANLFFLCQSEEMPWEIFGKSGSI